MCLLYTRTLRVGIHSGPVTAGVLRGERSRFQLFGDTMNTAARMEQTGQMDKIHVSSITAKLLRAAGKEHWVRPRECMIEAKGKGKLQTYWARVMSDSAKSSVAPVIKGGKVHFEEPMDDQMIENRFSADSNVQRLLNNKTTRLIDWNVDVLQRLLRQVIARRQAMRTMPHTVPAQSFLTETGKTPLQEVVEIIALPEFDARVVKRQVVPESIALSEAVIEQLQKYVTNMAVM
jgi:Adenylate and Guanylate cyclase catalytic domain